MKAVIQRVSKASVNIENMEIRSIGPGLLVLLGIGRDDETQDVKWLAQKIAKLRLFDKNHEKFKVSVRELMAEVLVISQFTLMASTKRGNRPSWEPAAPAHQSRPIYEYFLEYLGGIMEKGKVVSGEFGSMMKVELVNNGPCTIIMDSKNRE